ncbi:MAG: ribosomal protein S18-alanine N-acetyltransferase [Chloroflexi bacterium]|nr:ribosomal protein S18-alanine N-acetyltransferase [Chloroflexota bacterium]
MKTIEAPAQVGPRPMGYFVRPMRLEDTPQVSQIERECFPTGWTATPFRRELRNRIASYLVAVEARDPFRADAEAREALSREDMPLKLPSLGKRLGDAIAHILGRQQPELPSGIPQRVAGFVGVWFMADEAHVTVIGTGNHWRRQGIGELLLLAAIEMSRVRQAHVVTLEVRASNTIAQALYEKYGFNAVGVRKGYYTDNREDAVIMTTDPIAAIDYEARLTALRLDHEQRWGSSVRLWPP